jgi:EAL domain-containing protein (putative c-di-GMP-specific phosphodiesterase class I)
VQISDCGERRTAHHSGSRQLAPVRLELEITETVLITDSEAAFTVLRQLRDLGAGIAIDDFGTGYSSLSYLRRFPFSKVKIDQSFIRGLGTDRNAAAIIKAVTDLRKTFGMSTSLRGSRPKSNQAVAERKLR